MPACRLLFMYNCGIVIHLQLLFSQASLVVVSVCVAVVVVIVVVVNVL